MWDLKLVRFAGTLKEKAQEVTDIKLDTKIFL